MTTVLSISSRVVRGHVGNAAAGFALQRLGHTVWEAPTVVWDRHPGFGRPSGVLLEGGQLAELLAAVSRAPLAGRIGLVATGYFASVAQIEVVAAAIDAIRAAGGRPLVCCDPVCGDDGRAYVPDAVLAGLRELLVPRADVITPNASEVALLAGRPVDTHDQVVAAAQQLGRAVCVVTSAPKAAGGRIANLLVTPEGVWRCETARLERVPHGTGDLLAALLAGWLAHGLGAPEAMARATAGVAAVLAVTVAGGHDELALAAAQQAMVEAAPVPVERL